MADQNELSIKAAPTGMAETRYQIHSPLEIAAVLDSLRKARSLLTAYFDGGKEFFLTCVVCVDEPGDRVVLDCGSDEATNERALQARLITFSASHQRIRIEFAAEALQRVVFEGREAFCMPLPETLLRLQRREYFRIDTPLSRPLRCVVPARGPKASAVEASILDISCGGVALADVPAGAEFAIGQVLAGCIIDLPDMGSVKADLVVKNAFEATMRNGARRKRFGLEFTDIPERSRVLIQRYINKMERERGNRAGGR